MPESEDDQNPYITPVENQCHSCGHLNRKNASVCTAFPEGIPLAILLGVFDHTHPYDFGGISDNGITYIPLDEV